VESEKWKVEDAVFSKYGRLIVWVGDRVEREKMSLRCSLIGAYRRSAKKISPRWGGEVKRGKRKVKS